MEQESLMITEKIFKQVLAMRDTGLTNMLDYHRD
ncbi:MAG: DUF5049 domain-containing protein [Synergistaceae bacterium]|nr:DUF5049 domain-containing protein [Synergistaceae bacterium]